MQPCPNCGSTTNARFERSNWCVRCVERELAYQRGEDSPRQTRQVIERGVGVREVR